MSRPDEALRHFLIKKVKNKFFFLLILFKGKPQNVVVPLTDDTAMDK